MSQYNTFFISHRDDGGEQTLLNAFLRSHRVLQVDRAVFPDGWAFCVEWLDGKAGGGNNWDLAYRKERIDYRETLSEPVFKVFAKMREVRKRMAERDGVAQFMILNNEQLAKLVQLENPSLTAMGRIDGVGEAKVKRYGKELLEELVKIKSVNPEMPSEPEIPMSTDASVK